jgi:AcrR family transcriptional regulator
VLLESKSRKRGHVPVARTGIDRGAKVNEILDAAEARLRAGGYQHMSVAAIARELGVAQNSIYWYFPSKDDLFVAVLRRLLARLADKKPPHDGGLVAQVLWATDEMHALAPLRSALRERARHSAAAAKFQRELDVLIRRLLVQGIEADVDEDDLEVAATAFLASVEGTLGMGLSKRARHQVITFALNRIVGVRA